MCSRDASTVHDQHERVEARLLAEAARREAARREQLLRAQQLQVESTMRHMREDVDTAAKGVGSIKGYVQQLGDKMQELADEQAAAAERDKTHGDALILLESLLGGPAPQVTSGRGETLRTVV